MKRLNLRTASEILLILRQPVRNVFVAKVARGAVEGFSDPSQLGLKLDSCPECLAGGFLVAHAAWLTAPIAKASDLLSDIVQHCYTSSTSASLI